MVRIKTKQTRKQRKRHFNAPLHRRNKRMTAPLSYELREKYGIRRLPVHKDDKVVVFQNKSEDEEIKGKVIRVLPQKYAIHVEGHSKEKADGTIVSFPVHPSNVVITSLHLRDKKRREMIQRRSQKELSDEEMSEDIFEEELEEETLEEDFEEDLLDEEELFEDLDELEMDDLDESDESEDEAKEDKENNKEDSK